jgi:ferredoxin
MKPKLCDACGHPLKEFEVSRKGTVTHEIWVYEPPSPGTEGRYIRESVASEDVGSTETYYYCMVCGRRLALTCPEDALNEEEEDAYA